MVKQAGVSLLHAVQMMTATPARIINARRIGRIAAGMDADLVVFDDNIAVKAVVAQGSIQHVI